MYGTFYLIIIYSLTSTTRFLFIIYPWFNLTTNTHESVPLQRHEIVISFSRQGSCHIPRHEIVAAPSGRSFAKPCAKPFVKPFL